MKDYAFPQALVAPLLAKSRGNIPKPMLQELSRLFRAESAAAWRKNDFHESLRLYEISIHLKEKAK